MLKIFNTLTKKKEKFKSINSGEIKMYVCGITAYDLCHIGHGRTFVIFDAVVRYLRHCGYQVNYTRNITDIDDKIIKRAYENNTTIFQLTNNMIKEMYLDLDSLNILRPNHEPKVTDYIDDIIKFIHLLIKKNHAYITSNGDVMFSIKTMNNYAILSKKIKPVKIYDYNINILPEHKNTIDFVLWKKSKSNEPYWPSPWGEGRPGWHIECSAISHAILGKHLDIHGGGSDLIFPHHDNEIAQSVCAHNNTTWVKIWMHTGMLLLDNKKMSKSLNNSHTIRRSLSHYDPETIRYFLMSAHYRSELKYTNNNINNARSALERLYIALRNTDATVSPAGGEHFINKFISKMNDDFNTPAAYSVLFEIAHELNTLKTQHSARVPGIASTLKYLANILGLLYQNPEKFLANTTSCNTHHNIQTIQHLISLREKARQNNQWKLADTIRQKLTNMGIKLEDDLTGKTKWHFYI